MNANQVTTVSAKKLQKLAKACEHPITKSKFSYARSQVFVKTCMLCGTRIMKE